MLSLRPAGAGMKARPPKIALGATSEARLRWLIVPDVLSIGRAALCVALATEAMASSSSFVPRSALASTATGFEPRAVIATRASATTPPSQRTAAATPAMGKSNAPRSRCLR